MFGTSKDGHTGCCFLGTLAALIHQIMWGCNLGEPFDEIAVARKAEKTQQFSYSFWCWPVLHSFNFASFAAHSLSGYAVSKVTWHLRNWHFCSVSIWAWSWSHVARAVLTALQCRHNVVLHLHSWRLERAANPQVEAVPRVMPKDGTMASAPLWCRYWLEWSSGLPLEPHPWQACAWDRPLEELALGQRALSPNSWEHCPPLPRHSSPLGLALATFFFWWLGHWNL